MASGARGNRRAVHGPHGPFGGFRPVGSGDIVGLWPTIPRRRAATASEVPWLELRTG